MRAHHFSASKALLAYICAYGFRADVAQYPRPPGTEARVGTLVHSMAEALVHNEPQPERGDPTELAKAQELFSPPLRTYLESHKWTNWEIGLRYNAETDSTERAPRRGEPGYSDVGPMVVPMTLDGVRLEGDCVTVIDLKSGKLVSDTEQLRVQAVAASRLYNVKRAKVGYLYARKTKCDEPVLTELDEDALDVEAGRIGRLLRTLPMAEPVPGDHCWKCSARPGCPAYGAEVADQKLRELEEAGMFG